MVKKNLQLKLPAVAEVGGILKTSSEDLAYTISLKLEEIVKQYSEICKTYCDNKEQEIEEAHNEWQINEAEERLNRREGMMDR